jgi:hypothetical protein
MTEPVGEQIAAHEHYLRLVEQLGALVAAGDTAAASRLRPKVSAAKRRWHALVRESDTTMRDSRPNR